MEEDTTPVGRPAHPTLSIVHSADAEAAGLPVAESLVTRLCHDLSGAMSAMANALEMAVDDPGASGEALSIAAEGSQAVNARLRLLRAAWGGSIGPTPMSDILAMIDGLPTRRRLQIDTDLDQASAALPGPMARILLNVLLVAAESLPHGGTISVSGEAGAEIIVAIGGRGAAWPPGLPGWLTSPSVALAATDDPRQLAGPLMALFAGTEGVKVSILMGGPPAMVPPLLLKMSGP
jgi:histidine phosphotransferase ChpT